MDLTLPSVGTLGQSKDENVPIQIPSEKFHSSPTPSNSSELKKEAVSLNYCPTCDKGFERLYNLKVHLRKHTGETPYCCPVFNCPKRFKWRSSMAHHVRAHHEPSELESSNLENNGLRLSTPSGRPFTGLSLLKKPISRKRHDGSIIRSDVKPSGNKNVTARKRTSRQSHAPQNSSSIRRSLSENIFSEGPIDPASAFHILTSKDVSIETWSFLDFEKPEEDAPVLDLQGLSKITSSEISEDTVSVPQDQPEPNEVLDQGMGFLAAVSEDATDAEMESLAKIEAQLFSPITAPSSPPMAVTMEETSPSN